MANPASRKEFGEYCLRRLGHPVIGINIAPEQMEDRIDDALSKFYDYHFDGIEEDVLIVPITDQAIIDGYLTIDDAVFSVKSIFQLGQGAPGSGNMFDAQYQFFLNDFYGSNSIASGALQYLETVKSYFATAQRSLMPLKSYHFNRKTNRIKLNESLSTVRAASPLLAFNVYKKLDIDEFPDIWDDEFLKDYATALIKKQWAENLKKFGNINLPGGITLNGDAIYSEAVEDITRLETKLIMDLQPPLEFILG